jgi:large subunit ribosomal protein L24
MKIRKGDRVVVLSGKDKGSEGVVMRAMPSVGKVVVEGVNIARRSTRATRATMQGGIIDKDMPMPVSKVAIVCPKDGRTRIGMRIDEDGTKHRICRKCGVTL